MSEHFFFIFFLLEMSWRKVQLKSKLINCFLFPLTLKGMSKLNCKERKTWSILHGSNSLPRRPGNVVRYQCKHKPSHLNRESGKLKAHTLLSRFDFCTSLLYLLFFYFFFAVASFSPLGTVPLIYFFFVLLFSHKLRSVSMKIMPFPIMSQHLGSLGNKWL